MPRSTATSATTRTVLRRIPRPVPGAVRDVLQFLVLAGALGWLALRGARGLGYHWQWYLVPKYLYSLTDGHFAPGPLLLGLWMTVKITAASLGLSLVFGLATALLRLSRSVVGQALALVYLESVRNTPLLIQIFFIYFVIAPMVGMSAFPSAVLALSLFEGAYTSEIIRAGIVSIHQGQWEAARGTGLGTWQAYRRVILPQALRRMLPPLTGQAVSLVKDSALASTIAVFELTMRGQVIVSNTFLTFEIWFTVAGLYLVMTLAMSLAAGALEKRFGAAGEAARCRAA